MIHQVRNRQRGVSILLLLFVLVVLAGVGFVGAQVFPTVVEYQAVLKAATKAKEGGSVAEVRSLFNKAAQVDDIRAIEGKDLEVTKENDRVVVKFAYDKEVHLWGPAWLLIKYRGQSK